MLENKQQRIVNQYSELRSENFNRPQYSFALNLLKSWNPANRNVIEFGGGRGEFSRLLQKENCSVTFIDINPENVQNAISNGFQAKSCDLNKPLPDFADEAFDGAVMLEVIEHINHSELLLSETCRILKRGGFLILSTPNPYFFWHRMSILFGNEIVGEGYHYRFYNRKQLEKTIVDSGFIIKIRNPSTSTFGLNILASGLFHKTINFRLPKFLHGLFARKFYILAVKK
ncbi:class I SAM-dependent methyltransferase [bacterium]|nr:MAG: class I SAM-dependent methyltransferase [bacterium]